MIKCNWRFFFILLISLGPIGLCAQIVVNTNAPYDTPTNLVQNVLLGEGVQAFNITFYGNKQQIGFFSNGENSIGLKEGIALSTGIVNEMSPPQSDPGGVSTEFSQTPTQGAGDADLFKVASRVPQQIGQNFQVTGTYDAAILEFDFIPSSDSVIFRYVFGSEEYLRYVDTKYNDVFGFFISGPGIDGEFSSPPAFPDSSINIALIPNTNIPITVSTVNDRRNSNFYINNPLDKNIVFNGYTAIFTAFARVIPCQVYHIKIAIADGTKSDLDSGVLIEARSFSSGSITLKQDIPVLGPTGSALEGCFNSRIVARRESVKTYNDTIYVTIDPTSQANNADISALPPFIIIPAGSDSGVYDFTILEDGLVEGEELLVLDFHLKSPCANLHKKYEIKLDDAPTMNMLYPNNDTIKLSCFDNGYDIDATTQNGYGFYSYKWEEDGVEVNFKGSVYHVDPSVQTDYTVTVSDTCNLPTISKIVRVIPANLVPLKLDLPDTIIAPCLGKNYQLQPDTISGGSAIVKYEWLKDGVFFSSVKSPILRADKTMMVSLTVTDSCGDQANDSIFFYVKRNPPIDVTLNVDTTICVGQQANLTASAVGGLGKLSYFWVELNDTNQQVVVAPLKNSTYRMVVTDECLDFQEAKVYVDVNYIKADFDYRYTNDFTVQVEDFSIGKNPVYQWTLDRDVLESIPNPVFQLNDLKDHDLKLVLVDNNGCTDSLSTIVLPQLVAYIPNSFTPNGDGYNDVFKVSVVEPRYFELTIFDRWGKEVFSTTDPDTGWNGVSLQTGKIVEGVYMVVLKVDRANQRRITQIGKLILMP